MSCVRDFAKIPTRNAKSAFITFDTNDLILASVIKNMIEEAAIPIKWHPGSHCSQTNDHDHSFVQVNNRFDLISFSMNLNKGM